MTLEKAGAFHGVYHVLLGRLAPLSGMGPEQLTIDALVARVHSGTIHELIMATNPNLEGDGTALLIANRLGQSNLRITRLARGLASGGTLEFANRDMLSDAFAGRQPF
jgi:recombination protein RecR